MSVLYIALPIALLLGGAGLWACLYCIRDGQYDDLDSASVRMLVDDRPAADAGSGDGTDPSRRTTDPEAVNSAAVAVDVNRRDTGARGE